MAKMYYMLSLVLVLLQIQTTFGAMNVTVGDIKDNQLNKINLGGSNGTAESLICPANGQCIVRGDPNYIIPKSIGKEKVENVFSDITTLEGLENNKKGLIVESCNIKKLQSNKCKTRKCAVNEDCFSGLCETTLGSCITNINNTISECTLNGNDYECQKYLQEDCLADFECASRRCKDFVCTYKYLNKLNTNPLVYYSSAIGILLFLILLFLCCCCCPGMFRWGAEEKRNNSNPPPVV